MQIAIFIYLLMMMLLWQVVGNFSTTIQYPEKVSKSERSLWENKNIMSIIGLILAKTFWIFALAYPIYWALTKSILQGITLCIVGNFFALFLTTLIKKLFSVPEIILVYLGIVLCPFLIIAIWFVGY